MTRSMMPLLALLFFGLVGPMLADDGYLPNGTMTKGQDSPTPWRAATGVEGSGTATAVRDTQVVKVGPASLRLSVTGGTRGSVTCPLSDVAGKEVAVSGWVRAEGKLTSAVLAFVCPGAEQSWWPVKEFAADASWHRVNTRLKLPAGGEAPFLMLQTQGDGQVWLDEVAVLPGERFQPEPLLSEFDGPPQFAFLAWEKQAVPADGGVRIKVPSGQGGAGFSLGADASPFADRSQALTVTAGPNHQAQSILVVLQDADGTAHEFTFQLSGIAPGTTATVTADDGASLNEPGKVARPGKQEGFDATHVTQLIVQGDWKAAPVDLTLRKLELVEPTAEILAARTKLRERLAAEAEARRKQEAQRAARTAELLQGAPHEADGPDIQHVAAVAPDTLVLLIQEQQFVPAPQVAYQAEPGDKIQREGKEQVLVVEDGKVQKSPIDVVVVRQQGNQQVRLGHLAINADRIKPDDTTTGQSLTDETVAEPQAYRIVVPDDANQTSPLTPTAVWWKRKPNAYRSLAHAVQVFLKLPQPLIAGQRYRVEFPGVNLRQAAVEYRHEPSRVRSPAVHVSAIGFRPDDPFKRAYLSVWLGTGGALQYGDNLKFQLLDDQTGQPVRSGPVELLMASDAQESFKAGRNYSRTDVLDEVLWNLDLYRRLQTPDGGVGGGIESTSHPRPGEASWQESLLLSAYAPDPASSMIYAATAAKLARALAGSDVRLSITYATSARQAWDWAIAHGDEFFKTRIDEKRRTRVSEEFGNFRNLAAFELWRLSSESTFHDQFRATMALGGSGNPMEQHKAIISYARLPDGQGDAAIRDAARQWVLEMADTALAFGDGNAFGVTTCIPQLPPMGFVGYLSTPEMIAAVLPHAWLLTRDPKYLAGAVRACQFSAGASPDNQALTTGLGPNPARFPLYIDSWVTGQPAPAGITVYGISDPAENYAFDSWAYTWFLQKMVPAARNWPTHESYWDIYLVPSSNEFTIHQTMIPTAFYWGFLAARDEVQ